MVVKVQTLHTGMIRCSLSHGVTLMSINDTGSAGGLGCRFHVMNSHHGQRYYVGVFRHADSLEIGWLPTSVNGSQGDDTIVKLDDTHRGDGT